MFDYLNNLRRSGDTNMFGASPYLENEFNIEQRKASDVLVKCMDGFNEDGYDHLLES